MYDENLTKAKTNERISRIKEAVYESTKKDLGVSKEKLVSILMLEWSVTRRTIMELIKMLLVTEYIREEDWGKEHGKVLFWNRPIKKEVIDAKQELPQRVPEGIKDSQ